MTVKRIFRWSLVPVALVGAALMDRPAQSQSMTEPFLQIAAVLQSPRCMNCHPAGDGPLQTDASRPHTQNIKRRFNELGGSCHTCHQDHNLPTPNTPPGAPHWGMPPAETPMVFQGKSPPDLCRDLLDPLENGNRSPDDLVDHVTHDPLILWAFDPGGGRTRPPMSHADFVRLMTDWVALGAPCPQ